MTPEFWIPMGSIAPEAIADRARQVEADGWDGMKVYDTQCLNGEAVVMMTAAAIATERLQLSIATSNPATRHPSVTASAMASIAAIAGDRIYFGIGRGDSALAYVGGAPASVPMFERFVIAVRRYLHGEPVPFESIAEWCITREVSGIHLGDAPAESRLVWPAAGVRPPPIEIFATGPRVLAVGGRWADRLSLGLGAVPARLAWGIETAREARAEAGLDPTTLSLAALVSIAVGDDMARARRSVANMVATAARFSVINGTVCGPVSDKDRSVYEAIGRSYDMTHHGGQGAQIGELNDEFIDAFAIVGSPQRCVERILELQSLGIDSIMLAPPLGDVDEADVREGYRRVVEDVLPAARKAAGARA
jgi:5,10-methylenetetrahydromethanopterin reductase